MIAKTASALTLNTEILPITLSRKIYVFYFAVMPPFFAKLLKAQKRVFLFWLSYLTIRNSRFPVLSGV